MLRYSLNRLTGIGEYIFQSSDNPDNGKQFESSDQQDYLAVNLYDTVTIENSIIDVFTPPNGYYDLPNYTKGRLASTAFRTRQSDNWNYKYYRYDERGRVKKMWLMLDGLELKTVNYEYNSQDMVKSLNYNSGADFKRFRYRYDFAGRLQSVDTYEGPENTDDSLYYTGFAGYQYNANSAMEVEDFLTGFTGTSVGYDNRGRIISYYSHNSEFIYNLSYLKNSNVQQLGLNGSYRDNFANTEDLVYKYTYDKSNRLLSATNFAGSSNEYKVENTYDKDGNILTLKRYGDAGKMQDDFAYQYYSGTNKLRKVSGTTDQYQYDLNGNVITDSVYNNFSISYDHRNLITELYHIDTLTSTRQYSYATRYWYDETGNRTRKLTYRNIQIPPPQITDWNNPGSGWTLLNNEHYVRGVNGKELATYSGNTLTEWYVWASDMVGKIKGNAKYFFFKDHLGSVRAVVDNNFNLVSAVDYDMWGDKMQGRIYNGDSTKFGFTGKEEDEESFYDYFGARYYDGRIASWISVDPLMEKHLDFNPYNYVLRNPMFYVDPEGSQVSRIKNDPGVTWHQGPVSPAMTEAMKYIIKFAFENTSTLIGLYKTVSVLSESLSNAMKLRNEEIRLEYEFLHTPYVTEEISVHAYLSEKKDNPIDENRSASDLISGTAKESKSYHEELSNKTYGEIKKIAQNKNDSRQQSAKQMKKLIEQSRGRLKEKRDQEGRY